jgi:hypothetical protein
MKYRFKDSSRDSWELSVSPCGRWGSYDEHARWRYVLSRADNTSAWVGEFAGQFDEEPTVADVMAEFARSAATLSVEMVAGAKPVVACGEKGNS